ncbi:histidinol-phosphatase [Pricia sp.]|uniref:histidinol-phosphatase n=1 Tax=Pricia sp. TaxID=2268138 RepID=UPI0035931584
MSNKIFLGAILLAFFLHNQGLCQDSKWFKGNLHAHSYWSDGDQFPEMIMEWYKSNEYDFTVLSDHNTLAEGEKWITLSEKEYLQKGFRDYLKKYGEDWVTHKLDSEGHTKVKLKTLKEYRPLFEEDGEFLIIQSEELTTNFGDKPIHINATNIQQKIDPRNGESVTEVIQNNIDAILEQRTRLHVPIMPHINHPNFGYGITADDFIPLHDVRFFEVYNGHPAVHNEGDSTHLGTEEMWDLINNSYLQEKKPLLYGVATDDSHHYHRFDKSYSNSGRGWLMVRTDSLKASSIIEAMEKGDFYASTGVVLKHLEIGNDRLKIEVVSEPGVHYEIQLIGRDATSKTSQIIEKVKGTKVTFTFPDGYIWVRAKVISDKTNQNFFDETEFEKAWTQPIIPNPN